MVERQFDMKMEKWSEQMFLKRHTNGHQVYEKCSTSLIVRDMQIKTTKACYLMLVKMAVIKKTKNTGASGSHL
jgi:hypothetical protein